MNSPGDAMQVELIAGCACLLAFIVLLLLHQQWRQHKQLNTLRQQLQQERAQRRQAEHCLIDTRTQLCQALADQDRVRDAERQRIGRDLHDDLGQQLLALTMEICALAASHPQLKSPLNELDAHVRQAVRSLRQILKDLAPESIEPGLRAAVEMQLSRFSKLSGIQCQLTADAQAFAAGADVRFQAMLFRLLQESLSNVARHAQASAVQVALCRQGGALSLTVRDNGVGLPEHVQQRPSYLAAIRQRVTAAGGQLHIASTPGAGTALSMSFPLEPTGDEA